MIYLDNAATTQIHPKVLDAMMPYLKNEYGNAGTLYGLGKNASNAISKARAQVANLINAKSEQIVFTSGGSEANNMVFHGVKDYLKEKGKKHIIVSSIEHDSVLKAAKNLIKDGFHITYLPVDKDGIVDLKLLEQLLSCEDAYGNNVGLVSIMYVNNEIGSVNPVGEIGRLCMEYGALFHTDCVQAAGSHPINVEQIQCDFLSISAHKIHASKGVGSLFIKNKETMSPLIHGGATQEFGYRGGTENVPGIVGFGVACELISSELGVFSVSTSFIKKLFYNKLIEELQPYGYDSFVSVNGASAYSTGKTLNLKFKDVDGETLVLMLASKDICISAGSACKSHESEPSHVLLGIGLEPDEARDSVRISFSIFNTPDEVSYAAEIIAKCVIMLGGYERR